MASNWKELGVPYNAERMEYTTYPAWNSTYVPADSFNATLEVENFSRGRSAATIYLKGVDGTIYPMFLTDFVDLVKTYLPDYEMPGCYTLKWEFVKRGANYGIRAVID